MRKIILPVFIACLTLFAVSCTSTDEYYAKQHDFSRYANLGEAIRSVGGMVTGGNTMAGFNDAAVQMRGAASLSLNTQPLFVVNNVPIGNDYNIANNLVHPSNIVSIQLVKGASASTLYGEEANQGAVIIRTREYKARTPGKVN